MPAPPRPAPAQAGAVVKKLAPGKPKPALLKIAYGETDLRRAVKDAGGVWHSQRRLWRAPLRSIKQLRLESRIVPDA
jgi:hypothetical protein